MEDTSRSITRRQLLTGAGAATAALGIGSFASPRSHAATSWDHDADIVVVGSGVGACTAAVIARENGDKVIMVEKAPILGGTSAKSAGVLWIPNNFTLRQKGVDDGKEDCLRYLARFSYPEHYHPGQPNLGLGERAYALLEAFYDNSSAAIDRLRELGALEVAEWRMFALDRSATDYLDNVPENKVPAGRPLGPVKPDGSVGFGVDLMRQLGDALRKREIPILFSHRVTRLVMDGAGRVTGVEAESAGRVVTVRARKAAVFATGGYVHNPALVNTHQRARLYGSCAMPWATGDFIGIAAAAGAQLGNMSGAWRTQIVLDEALLDRHIAGGVFFPPGDSMLQVNRYGRRVVNEKRNYNDRTEAHGYFDPTKAEFPNQLLFMIYDQRTAEAYAGAYPLPATPTAAPYVLHAESLEGLAAALQKRLEEVAPRTGGFLLSAGFLDNLRQTIARFNGLARAGKDEDFGRGAAGYDREWQPVFSPMREGTKWPVGDAPNDTMHPLRDQGPYYAIVLAAGALDTNGGPAIDASARVLDPADRPIPGLYGAGNCIASPSRFAYWGAGHTLGQALTFGYIAANAAHREPRSAD